MKVKKREYKKENKKRKLEKRYETWIMRKLR